MRWLTFLRLHAQGIIACDFFVAVTATFRLLYVLVVIEHRGRRLIHYNVTAHPNATWTLQQLREAVGYEEQYRFLIHDRDGRHRRGEPYVVRADPILGGLHHEYALATA